MPLRNGMPPVEELRSYSDDQLIEKIDEQYGLVHLSQTHFMIAQIYYSELARRPQEEATRKMLHYTEQMYLFTKQVRNMTKVIVVFRLSDSNGEILGVKQIREPSRQYYVSSGTPHNDLIRLCLLRRPDEALWPSF